MEPRGRSSVVEKGAKGKREGETERIEKTMNRMASK